MKIQGQPILPLMKLEALISKRFTRPTNSVIPFSVERDRIRDEGLFLGISNQKFHRTFSTIRRGENRHRLVFRLNFDSSARNDGTFDRDSPRAASESFFVEFEIKSSTVPGAPYRRA